MPPLSRRRALACAFVSLSLSIAFDASFPPRFSSPCLSNSLHFFICSFAFGSSSFLSLLPFSLSHLFLLSIHAHVAYIKSVPFLPYYTFISLHFSISFIIFHLFIPSSTRHFHFSRRHLSSFILHYSPSFSLSLLQFSAHLLSLFVITSSLDSVSPLFLLYYIHFPPSLHSVSLHLPHSLSLTTSSYLSISSYPLPPPPLHTVPAGGNFA